MVMFPIVACLPLKVNLKQLVQQNQRIEEFCCALRVLCVKLDVKKCCLLKKIAGSSDAGLKGEKKEEILKKSVQIPAPLLVRVSCSALTLYAVFNTD